MKHLIVVELEVDAESIGPVAVALGAIAQTHSYSTVVTATPWCEKCQDYHENDEETIFSDQPEAADRQRLN